MKLALALLLALPAVASPINDKQFAKLDASLETSEDAMVPNGGLLVALGLPKPKKEYELKYRALSDDPKEGPSRMFSRSKKGDYLLNVGSKDGVRYLRFSREGTLAGAVFCPKGSGDSLKIEEKEAAGLLERELAFWAAKADAL